MADKYLNLSGLQAFYNELKNHYPTTATSATTTASCYTATAPFIFVNTFIATTTICVKQLTTTTE